MSKPKNYSLVTKKARCPECGAKLRVRVKGPLRITTHRRTV